MRMFSSAMLVVPPPMGPVYSPVARSTVYRTPRDMTPLGCRVTVISLRTKVTGTSSAMGFISSSLLDTAHRQSQTLPAQTPQLMQSPLRRHDLLFPRPAGRRGTRKQTHQNRDRSRCPSSPSKSSPGQPRCHQGPSNTNSLILFYSLNKSIHCKIHIL